VKTILYLSGPEESTCTALKFNGARTKLASEGYTIRKIFINNIPNDELSSLVDFWQASGLIVDCCGLRPPLKDNIPLRVPYVFLDIAREFESPDRISVSYDIRTTCNMAARELLSLGCASYGYAGYGETVPWSEERKRVFSQALRLNGHSVETFGLSPITSRPSVFYKKLSNWLQRLPKPMGIFAADDAFAIHLYSAVQNLKLRIPSDVAILGVDDEFTVMSTPGISSIQLDFLEAGRLSAELLLNKIADPTLPPTKSHFGPIQLLRRSSTRKLRCKDNNLLAIVQQIREQAPHGLTAAKAAAMFPGSRCLAELRFRQMTGHSILEEITAARIERAKELLRNVDNPIGEIAGLCGYRTFNAFRNAFKSQTGLTPRDWRQKR